MNQRAVGIGLIISLVFNLAFVGAFVYRKTLTPKDHWRSKAGVVLRRPFHLKEDHLSKEQRRALDRIREPFSPRIQAVRNRLFEERNRLATLISAAKPDTHVISVQLERIGKHQVALEKEVVHQILLEKNLLDPAQRELFIGGILHRMMGPQHRIIFPPPPPPEGYEKEDCKEKTPTEEKP